MSVPPCECSREPARVLFLSVTFGVRVRPGKSTIGHGGTMQPDTATRLTQGVPGAPGVGHATAFFLVEEHDSSLGDERASTSADQTDAQNAVIQASVPGMDNTGPSPGAADQSIEGSSGAAPFTGSVVPTENPTTLVKMSVSELAGDDEDRRLVDQAQSGVSSWQPPVTHGAMDTLSLSVPFKGGVALDHPSTQGTKKPGRDSRYGR